MDSERTYSMRDSSRMDSMRSQSARLVGGMVHVTSAPATEPESAPVRPSMPRQASREQVPSSRRTMGLEQPAPPGSSEAAAELGALVHFVNELLSHGDAGGEDGGQA